MDPAGLEITEGAWNYIFFCFSYTVSEYGYVGQSMKDWYPMSAAGQSSTNLIPNTTANSYYYSNYSDNYPPINYMSQQQSAVFSQADNLPTLPADPFAPKTTGTDENKMAPILMESLNGDDPFAGEGLEAGGVDLNENDQVHFIILIN